MKIWMNVVCIEKKAREGVLVTQGKKKMIGAECISDGGVAVSARETLPPVC